MIDELIKSIGQNYEQAGLDQLQEWHSCLTIEFAYLATDIGQAKKNRARDEIDIKADLIKLGEKPTEKAIERVYYASMVGSNLAYNQELIKAVGKLISSVRFQMLALRGEL